MKLFAYVLLFTLLIVAPASADVYLCEGKYTSTPCDDQAKALELKPLSRAGAVRVLIEGVKGDSADASAAHSAEGGVKGGAGTFTRLRVVNDPVWTLEIKSQVIEVKGGEAIVKNVGRKVAQGVVVEVNIPGKASNAIKMTGPDTIEPGKSAVYKFEEKSTIRRGAPLLVRIRCDNCWH